MSENALSALQQAFGDRCLTRTEKLALYEIPERGAPGEALAVLLPESEADVQRALEIANREGLHYVVVGGRTGLVEAQRPQGEIVLSLERLHDPIAFTLADGREHRFGPAAKADDARAQLYAWWMAQGQPEARGATLTVQAGMAVDALNELLEPVGLVFPMEMGSSASASVGACVANASAGANAVCYGTAAHMSQAAWGFWGNGEPAGPSAAPVWQKSSPEHLAIDSTRLPEDWGLVGSQGVLGVITRVQLRTQPLPQSREAVLLALPDMPRAMQLFAQARERFGEDIEEFEFLSRSAVELVLRRKPDLRLPFAQVPALPYLVLLQIKSALADEELAQKLYLFCAEDAGLADEHIGYAPLPALKKIRHSVTEASNLEMRALGGGRLSFDTATPVAVFGAYLDELARRLRELSPQVQLIDFGHAGVGGAHLHLIGSAQAPVSADAERLTAAVFDITQQFGGTFSAEHGVGPKWADEFLRRTPPERLQALAARKRRHDPNAVLHARSFGLDRLLARQ